MPGLTGELVVTTLVCFLHCTRGCGCIGARHSPRPLIFRGGDFMHTSGASRRENAEVCLSVMYGRPPLGKGFFGFRRKDRGAVMYTASRCGQPTRGPLGRPGSNLTNGGR